MPHVDALTLEIVDRVLRAAGVLAFAVYAWRLARSGFWRDPLSGVNPNRSGPSFGAFLAILAGFYILVFAAARVVGIDPEALRNLGSHDWHLARCVEDGTKLLVCGAIVVLLRRHRLFAKTAHTGATEFVRVAGVSAVAVLIIFALTNLQLQAGQIVWHWLRPDAQAPVHPVLEALQESAWGDWGALYLTVAAVIIAPVAEELFFRGMMLQVLWRHLGHAWLAIALSAVAFGLMHNGQPQDVLPLATMGVVLGYVRLRYRSLAACVATHMLFNGRTMLFVLLNPEVARGAW